MFAVCHTLDNKDDTFIMYDKKDMKEIAEHIGIVIEEHISLAKVFKDYSFYPIVSCNDLILRSLNHKARTNTHVLDELGIRTLIQIKQEFDMIQSKASKFSRSERMRIEEVYHTILNMDQSESEDEEPE